MNNPNDPHSFMNMISGWHLPEDQPAQRYETPPLQRAQSQAQSSARMLKDTYYVIECHRQFFVLRSDAYAKGAHDPSYPGAVLVATYGPDGMPV
ncbi:MAG: hypothetical protein EOM24_24335 [Chloroflexia bacterium]|nr:hypothetical protein [Chloroflexia bacterium]